MSDVSMWNGKRIQTQVCDIAQDTTTIRSLDWDRDRFDIEFGLQQGTTYNSYIIKGTNATALVDASHEKFRELYLATLRGQIDISKINYLVVSHTEPDHSGLVADILELNPEIEVIGSKVCIQFLQNLVHFPFKNRVVKVGDTLDLGGEHVLEFVTAPNLHWPDTMFTFDRGTGLLFTCDAFGSHLCTSSVFDEDLQEVLPHYRFYYDCLMRPNAKSVLTALRKTKDMEFTTICNGHGPLIRYNLPELVGNYQDWSAKANKATNSVVVMYTSDYGFSDRLSQALARGLTKTGVAVEMLDLNVTDTQELVETVGAHSGIALLAPPSEGPAHDAMKTLLACVKSKQTFLVAESYGGNDDPVDVITSQLIGVGLTPLMNAIRCRDDPTEETYQQYEEAGTDFGQSITQKDVIKAKKEAMDNETAKALGRISGGLYVVTAAKGSSRSAMIASWVAQASFEPLGLSIAVAKDRAIESLMQVGDKFALNCLDEDTYNSVMKHFLKRFPPGADRFEGIGYRIAQNGSPVLEDSVAFMECTVVKRMEVADHWIVYGEVSDGRVTKPDSKTAVHHRKVGSYY